GVGCPRRDAPRRRRGCPTRNSRLTSSTACCRAASRWSRTPLLIGKYLVTCSARSSSSPSPFAAEGLEGAEGAEGVEGAEAVEGAEGAEGAEAVGGAEAPSAVIPHSRSIPGGWWSPAVPSSAWARGSRPPGCCRRPGRAAEASHRTGRTGERSVRRR